MKPGEIQNSQHPTLQREDPDSLAVANATEIDVDQMLEWSGGYCREGMVSAPEMVTFFSEVGGAFLHLSNPEALAVLVADPTIGEDGVLEVELSQTGTVLAGSPDGFAALLPEMSPLLEDVLDQGADLILFAEPNRSTARASDALRSAVAVFDSGEISWLSTLCGQSFADEINAFTQTEPNRSDVVYDIFRGGAELQRLDEFLANAASETRQPDAWEDLASDRRNVDIEDTPGHILDGLMVLPVMIELPVASEDWAITICGSSELGWLGCASTNHGSTIVDMLVDPQMGIELHILDNEGSFDSKGETVVRIAGDTIEQVVGESAEVGLVLHVYPLREFETLADLREASMEVGGSFGVAILPYDDAVALLPDTGPPTPTAEP